MQDVENVAGDIDSVPRTRAWLQTWVKDLADRPSCKRADSAAEAAAIAAGYIIPPTGSRSTRKAGRALSADALLRTGVAELVLEQHGEYDRHALAVEVAQYLAGPSVPIWDYGMVDADVKIAAPVELSSGWELATPTSEELRNLLPVPSAHLFQSEQPFDLATYGGLSMLRRKNEQAEPRSGHIIYFPSGRPALPFWEPLLMLSLYRNDVIHFWAHYLVEAGRTIGTVFRDVYTEPWTPDGETFFDEPHHGSFIIRSEDEPHFRRFVDHLRPHLARSVEALSAASKKERAHGERLRRVAHNLIIAGTESYGEGVVDAEYNAETALRYVIALEGLLSSGDSDKSDLARKTAQRAAILAGTNDKTRLAIRDWVTAAYSARSKYAHGEEPSAVDLSALRRVTRRCVLARIILGDPPVGYPSLAALADTALLSERVRSEEIRGPIEGFWEAVGGRPTDSVIWS